MRFLSDPNFWMGTLFGSYAVASTLLIAFVLELWGVGRKK